MVVVAATAAVVVIIAVVAALAVLVMVTYFTRCARGAQIDFKDLGLTTSPVFTVNDDWRRPKRALLR